MRKVWAYDPHSGGVKIPQAVRAMRNMSPAFSTTGLFMVHPKRHLKLPPYTYKIEVGRMFKKPRDFTRLAQTFLQAKNVTNNFFTFGKNLDKKTENKSLTQINAD